MTIFNPPIVLRNERTGNVGALGTKDGRLAIVNKRCGARVIAPDCIIVERQPVTTWLMGILLDVWVQFAHQEPGDRWNSGGLSALDDVHDVLMSAGLIDENGAPKKAMSLLLGAGGMEEK